MKLIITPNAESVTVQLPDTLQVDQIGRTAAGPTDIVKAMNQAVDRPLDSPPLNDFLRDADDLLVVVNDATRATPTGTVLSILGDRLTGVGNLKIIVATGLHRAPTDQEYRTILGQTYDRFRPLTVAHDGHDLDSLVWIDGGNHKILINPALARADRVLVINSVEPHFFAGYTGGRKSFLPGLAGYPSVEASHAAAVHPDAVPLRIAGNPVRGFIESNTGFVDPARTFAIQLVLDRFDKIAQISAGNLDQAFRLACAGADSMYTMSVNRRYDIVLAVVKPPLNINLYQAEKSWEHARYGLKNGGILICVSACPEGVGSSFYQRLSEKYPEQNTWIALAEQPYEMGLHKLVRTARMRAQGELWLVSNIADDTARKFWYEPKVSVQAALDEALTIKGPHASLLVIDDAALTVPVVSA